MSACYGFLETANVPRILKLAAMQGLEFDMMATTFLLGRENLIPTERLGMARVAVRHHVEERPRRHGLFQHSPKSRDRDRRAGRAVAEPKVLEGLELTPRR